MDSTVILERPVPGVHRGLLRDFVARACRAADLRGAVTVLVTGDSRIRLLNSRFRGNRRSTDVLSFPAGEFSNGFLGDIAISADSARRQAGSLGHSVADEMRILILHGILHLAGYDHERNYREMAEQERRLRRRLGLPMALIERSSAGKKRVKPDELARKAAPSRP